MECVIAKYKNTHTAQTKDILRLHCQYHAIMTMTLRTTVGRYPDATYIPRKLNMHFEVEDFRKTMNCMGRFGHQTVLHATMRVSIIYGPEKQKASKF